MRPLVPVHRAPSSNVGQEAIRTPRINMFRLTLFLPILVLLLACERAPTAPLSASRLDVTPQAQLSGLVRTTWPSADDPGPPFYARIEPFAPHVFVADGWAVIVFYREPECIPGAFNLLVFFAGPAAFACPLTIEGSSLWHGAPFSGTPKIAQAAGTGAVPIWFIPASEVIAAMQDNVLTVPELSALPGVLMGEATVFNETLHPQDGHRNPMLVINARGDLEDGRTFQYHLALIGIEVKSTHLRFR
jgi:hypothetical protein